jgi:hypothetical protein
VIVNRPIPSENRIGRMKFASNANSSVAFRERPRDFQMALWIEFMPWLEEGWHGPPHWPSEQFSILSLIVGAHASSIPFRKRESYEPFDVAPPAPQAAFASEEAVPAPQAAVLPVAFAHASPVFRAKPALARSVAARPRSVQRPAAPIRSPLPGIPPQASCPRSLSLFSFSFPFPFSDYVKMGNPSIKQRA